MGLSLSDVHIIGCSLGAHTSGFVGHSFPGQIGRITGLDPAYPGFAGPGIDKLNQTSFGIAENLVHIDFWPNNGVGNADCITPCMKDHFKNNAASVDNLSLCASCSHVMAANYFVDSIDPKHRNGTAHHNTDYDSYKEGVCNGISVENNSTCAIIGQLAILSKPHKNDTTGKSYYLNTNSKSPIEFNQSKAAWLSGLSLALQS
ncbi:unnamed protein product [Medioppia subpectinata]|uniref:Lipase domain-containing protein n=1 Tax=Medioppia subpectinata TaxID=1979941 RepID=A0A7R9LL58_9ACAR|nr:unnamed protein product [Medioppia subpectinata]CAG2119428.1 unnamed protein product [Medioppia subpectinata]